MLGGDATTAIAHAAGGRRRPRRGVEPRYARVALAFYHHGMDPNDPERLDIETAVDMVVRLEARAQKGRL